VERGEEFLILITPSSLVGKGVGGLGQRILRENETVLGLVPGGIPG